MEYHIKYKSKFTLILIFMLISVVFLGNIFLELKVQNNHELVEIPLSSEIDETKIIMYFFINPACPNCIEKNSTINEFISEYPEIIYRPIEVYTTNQTALEFAYEYFGTNLVPNPSVVFEKGSCKYLLEEKYISLENLDIAYNQINNTQDFCNGWQTYKPYNVGSAFITGLVSGLSPCIILITGLLGTSLFSTKSKSVFFSNMISFILAVLCAYLFIGVLFWYFLDVAQILFNGLFLKLVIGIPLIILGLWYIIDAWNEKSKLFNTPDKLKIFFKKVSGKNSIFSAFILGFSFTLLKSPCIAGVLISLLFNIDATGNTEAFMIPSLITFAIGVIIPILVLFLLIRLGIASEKIDNNRKKIRPYLRIISGLIIIITTITSIV